MPPEASSLPYAIDGEPDSLAKWYNKFFKRADMDYLLSIAQNARGGGHQCLYGARTSGAYNCVIFLKFDDDIEWVLKVPQYANFHLDTENQDEDEKMQSEYATLLFLEELGTVPAPKVHACNYMRDNPAKTPYIFMDKVAGVPLIHAIDNGIGRENIHRTLTDLATIRKNLLKESFAEIGSLHAISADPPFYIVDFMISGRTIQDTDNRYGPYASSLHYYTHLLGITWKHHIFSADGEDVNDLSKRWTLHLYLLSILAPFLKGNTNKFYLAHTDLDAQNIFVNDDGSIAGIIDWEFAVTLPLRAAEHYPLILADKSRFQERYEDVFDDPLAELQEWRNFYAKEFQGMTEMEDYLKDIDMILAFEDMIRDHEKVTTENMVEVHKLIDSIATLEHLPIPFPWNQPTTAATFRPFLPPIANGTTRADIMVAAPETHPAGKEGTEILDEKDHPSVEETVQNGRTGERCKTESS